MLVLCYGIPKSGSTLAYELVRGALISAGYRQDPLDVENVKATPRGVNFMRSLEPGPNKGGERHVSMSKESISRVISEIGRRIIAVKTHEPMPPDMFFWLEGLQLDKKLQVIASYRDPRDVCLSLLDTAERAREKGRFTFSRIADLDHAAENVKARLTAFRRWAALTGTLRLNYDTVAFSPDDAIGAIERTLGIHADHQAVKKHAFEDAFTQKNKAVQHRYLVELDSDQQKSLTRHFGRFIKRVCEDNDDEWFATCRERMLTIKAKPLGNEEAATTGCD